MQTTKQSPCVNAVAFLERWHWYRALPDSLRIMTLQGAILRDANAGAYIARAGEPSSHWYGVIDGYLQMLLSTRKAQRPPSRASERVSGVAKGLC